MKSVKTLGIRQKFEIILAVCFICIGVFLFIYFPWKQKSEMTNSLEEKGVAIAQMIAQSSSAGIIFDDASSVTTFLQALKEMHDVDFAMVFKKDGSKFTAYNEPKFAAYAPKAADLQAGNVQSYYDDDEVMAAYPILSGKDKVGTVIIGMSKSNINSVASSNRLTALLISLVVLFFGLAGMRVFFNRIINTPIKNLTRIADQLSSGDVDLDIESKTHDEIGQLERSFVKIIGSVREQSDVIGKISQGDLSTEAHVKSNKDVLSTNLNEVIKILRGLIDEVRSLTRSAADGRLTVRGDAAKYSGGYKEIVSGINETLDAVMAPITEGVDALGKMAAGDLTVRITSAYNGDHQLIKNSINTVAESLNNTLVEVNEAIGATANASSEISSSSEEMAAGAQEQNSQTADVATAVEQMAKTIIETTRNSGQASEAAKNAGLIAKEGGMVVGETIEGMNRVSDVVKKSADIVHTLGKSSNEIGEIVQVIDDIADQTNLLALNAAIEAARAGEQGRGFAVVADEVRKLAERTTKATKEIAAMIRQIQKDTESAVVSMKEGTAEVERGKVLADKAGSSLKQIISGAQEVVDISSQVAAASEEQSTAAEQISKNIESISNVTRESATGVQQIARAAEDLSRLTGNLQDLILKFKIEGASQGGAKRLLASESKRQLTLRTAGKLSR
jgi:methyl-accepting chemotaxis protein